MSSDCVKVVLVGEAAAGKSALAQRLGYDSFTIHTLPTIGIDFIRVRRPGYRMHLWDTAGQDRFRSIISSYYRMGKVLVLVVDSTMEEQDQEQALRFWRQQCADHNPDGLFAVVATKADLVEESTDEESSALGRWCEQQGVPHFRTSARTGEGVEEAFAELVRLHRERQAPTPHDAGMESSCLTLDDHLQRHQRSGGGGQDDGSRSSLRCCCRLA